MSRRSVTRHHLVPASRHGWPRHNIVHIDDVACDEPAEEVAVEAEIAAHDDIGVLLLDQPFVNARPLEVARRVPMASSCKPGNNQGR